MTMSKPLQSNDEIRVIAPSCSRYKRGHTVKYRLAQKRLEDLGYKVTFGKNVASVLHLGTASAELRAQDFNQAYADKNVKLVMAMHGGWAANEILPLIDWQLVRDNPKPLIGFSDITVLVNAVYAMTGQVCYLGPNFGTLGSSAEWRYTLDNFNAAVSGELPKNLNKSKHWRERGSEVLHRTKPWQVLQPGSAQGTLIGGNSATFYLLQGTPYQSKFEDDFILAFEDDDESGKYTLREFSRQLDSLLQQPGARKYLKGMVIGRFQSGAKISSKDLASVIISKNLGDIPVIAGVDFGHTLPLLTLPIGGRVSISAGRTIDCQIL
jgi:muramoyltetrapeptide carboxypeptidase